MKSKFFREAIQKKIPTMVEGITLRDGESPSQMKPFLRFEGVIQDSPVEFTPISIVG